MTKSAYFDHNATTPLRPQAREFLLAALDECGNASSTHSYGRKACTKIENARATIAKIMDVATGQIIFNSGATEGNNTVLHAFAPDKILISAIEHSSINNTCPSAPRIPVNKDGVIDVAALSALLEEHQPQLVSVMLVNNETGVIQPIFEISKLVHASGAKFHVDAVQAFGKIPFPRASIDADFITISAHKIGGPQGVGALILAPSITLEPLITGGGQEKRMRAGTENVAGISGFGAATAAACNDMDYHARLQTWRDQIEQHIASSRITILGKNAPRISSTTSIIIHDVSGETLLMALDLEGIAASGGSACSSGTTKFSHVLKAMGIAEDKNTAALRLSMGWNTTQDDVEYFIAVWNKLRAGILK